MTEEAPAVEGQAPVAAPETQGQAPAAEQSATWFESAPDEIKGYIQNKGWDDPMKAVSSYKELEKFHGASEADLLMLPKDPDAEGAYDPIYNKLGRPESADKYEIELPEGIEVDAERLGGIKDVAHKLGLNSKQLGALIDYDAAYSQKAMEAHNEQLKIQNQADYDGLLKEWGSNSEERMELSRRGLRSQLEKAGIPSDQLQSIADGIEQQVGPAVTLKLFANIGEGTREDALPSSTGDAPFGYTREQAAADRAAVMAELRDDPAKLAAYNQGKGPQYDKMKQLNKVIAS